MSQPPSQSPSIPLSLGSLPAAESAAASQKSPEAGSSSSPQGKSSPQAGANSESSLESNRPKYSVAMHTVRITKHGFALDPVDLKYHDIVGNLSQSSRRNSESMFDGSQLGHKILAIIRGFWSQPGFPRGRLVRSDMINTLELLMREFNRHPPYPHRDTFGASTTSRPIFEAAAASSSPSGAARRGQQGRNRAAGLKGTKEAQQQSQQHQPPALPESTIDQIARGNKFMNLSLPARASPQGPQSLKATAGAGASKRADPPSSVGSNLISAIFGSTASSLVSQPKQSSSSGSASGSTSSFGAARESRLAAESAGSSSGSSSLQSVTLSRPYFFSWIPREKEEIGELVSSFLVKMQGVFAEEARILSIQTPCTVLGDIHGNLCDLRTYERSLWPKAPACLSSNYLFLGDYVDRGDFSVECVLYLFAMKMVAPRRFFMLRGNHEVAAIQRQYTFSRECEIKFGPSLGRQIWRLFNKAFDLLPVAAIVDDHIFCAHGGIPRSVGNLKQLSKEIPAPMENPESQCPSAWEILWNDPITDTELIGMIEMENSLVTQTQITQTAADANSAITTTTSIKSQSEQQPGKPGEPSGQQQPAISEADRILSREPPVALSFYIKPAPDSNPSSPAPPPQAKSSSAEADASREAPEADDTIKRVPSDTSSVASTSPQQMINDGFVANIKRGTAYLFSDQAINNFLRLNNLSHVIRAHEVIPTGFAFHGDGRVITIFSSSKYCGLDNQAACAFIDQNRIRILRLDTGEAGE